MNLNGLGASVKEIDRISEVWSITDIIPMAANLQMVFYRNKAGEVIVHFSLNEKEATLPIETYQPDGAKNPQLQSITSGATSNPIGMTFCPAPLTVCLWRDFCRRIAAGRAGGRGDRTGREQED